MVRENRATDIGVILRTGMGGQKGSPRHIGMIAGNGVSAQIGTLVRIGVITDDGVIKNPGIIPWFKGQVAFTLHKAAQIPGLDLAADVPQGADAVEEGVCLMGDFCDLVFLVGRRSQLLFLLRSFSE